MYIFTMTHLYVWIAAMNIEALIAKSKVVMRTLEDKLGYTVTLGILSPDSEFGTVLYSLDGTAGLNFHLEPGFEFYLHTSAPGKAMLAHLPADERAHYYQHMQFRAFTPNSITSQTRFNQELETVVKNGFAVDIAEHNPGCHCIAVPICDPPHRPIAAIWASSLSQQLPIEQFQRVADLLNCGAKEIADQLHSSHRASDRQYINTVIEEAKQILENNLNQSVDVERLAHDLYVSYSWFRQVFKEYTGQAPKEYHTSRRIEKAAILLEQTHQSIRQISETIGFKNQNQFSAQFKRKTGYSPLNYRDRSRHARNQPL